MSFALPFRVSPLTSLLLLASSCSVLYDLSPDQCERSSECASFGADYVCDAGICKGPTNTGSGGSDASGGTMGGGAGKSAGGGGSSGGTTPEGGAGSNAGGAGAGSAGEGGSGGVAPPECTEKAECDTLYGTIDPYQCVDGKCERVPPECSLHADCPGNATGEPSACIRGFCKPLLTDDCPVVLPRLTGSDDIFALLGNKTSNAIILGAMMEPGGTTGGPRLQYFDLALREIHLKGPGIPWPGSPRRDVLMVVCESSADAAASNDTGRHLAYDLNVPAIVGAINADDVQRLFELFRSERGRNVFFLTPSYSDETLVSLEDDGLIWHMLSGASALAATYKPLVEQVETHLRNNGSIPSGDMRLALLTSDDDRFLYDLGAAVFSQLRFNSGKSPIQNGANFFTKVIKSYKSDPMADHSATVSELLAFKPHVVIGASDGEFPQQIIPLMESQWSASASPQARPFYVLSPNNYNSTFLNRLTVSSKTRLLGVNWAAAEDPKLYSESLARYHVAFQTDAPGFENWYDTMYYLTYAMASARSEDAVDIFQGFKRLLAGQGVDVGPAPLATGLGKAQSGAIKLMGTGGPPNWDSLTGARLDGASVWCINGSNMLVPDVLRYVPADMQNPASLSGTFPCFGFPATP